MDGNHILLRQWSGSCRNSPTVPTIFNVANLARLLLFYGQEDDPQLQAACLAADTFFDPILHDNSKIFQGPIKVQFAWEPHQGCMLQSLGRSIAMRTSGVPQPGCAGDELPLRNNLLPSCTAKGDLSQNATERCKQTQREQYTGNMTGNRNDYRELRF